MKIHNQVLKPETISALQSETRENTQEATWRLSTLFWPADIQVGTIAGIVCKIISEEVASQIESEIKHLLPAYNRIIQQIYLWPRGSSISLHNDANQKFGATIYLNSVWHIDNGGLFVWQDKEDDEWKVRIPEYNSMVLNDQEEPHLVTPVANTSMDMRHTVQIWGV